MGERYGVGLPISGVYVLAARRLGMSPQEYAARRSSGQRWCGVGRHWAEGADMRPSSPGKCRACNPNKLAPCAGCGLPHLAGYALCRACNRVRSTARGRAIVEAGCARLRTLDADSLRLVAARWKADS